MVLTERELLDDIFQSFTLPKVAVHNLMDYEKELIYETFKRYDKKYLEDLLDRADKKGYNSISDKILAPEPKYYTRPKEYIIKKKPKNKKRESENRDEKNKTESKKTSL